MYDANVESMASISAASAQSGKLQQGCVLIADPLAGLRSYAAGIVSGVSLQLPRFIEAATGPQVIEMARMHNPELVIMDVAMPIVNGIKAAAEIWATNPNIKILFWTQYHREVYVRDLGRIVPDHAIHGYLLKNHSDDKLKHAILSVWIHDNPYIDPELRGARPANKDSALSDREFETLQDLALGLTERGIARRRHISIRGVQCRVAALYTKLIPARGRQPEDSATNELFSLRGRMLFEAMKRGLIETDALSGWEAELQAWLRNEYGVE